jgi:hypothetical protein
VRRASSTPLPASSQRLSPLRRWRTQSGAMRCLCLCFNCTNAYTFAFEKCRMSVVYQNNGHHADFGRPDSAVNMCSLVQLKIPFRKECRFEPDHPHQLIRMIHLRHCTVAGSCPSGVWQPARAVPRVSEMTIGRHCHVGQWNPGRDSAIAHIESAKRLSSMSSSARTAMWV